MTSVTLAGVGDYMSMKKSFPLFNYPTEIIFVDDDPFFLSGLCALLEDSNHRMKTFTHLNDAIEYINNKTTIETILHQFLNPLNNENEDSSRKTLLENLCEYILENPPEFDASVVFVDFHMKDMNGIEFCRKISNSNIKKVIITAGMEESRALKAFNEGVIDFFISKKEEPFADILSKAIDQMKTRFFVDISNKLGIIRDVDDSLAYQEKLENFLQINKITEYYAIDEFGSYLCFDKQKEKHFFLCLSEAKLNELLSIAETCHAEDFIIKTLQENTHGIFLLNESDRKKPVSEWNSYLYKFSGSFLAAGKKHYYAIKTHLLL